MHEEIGQEAVAPCRIHDSQMSKMKKQLIKMGCQVYEMQYVVHSAYAVREQYLVKNVFIQNAAQYPKIT